MNGIKIILFLIEKRLVEESDITRTILFAQPSEFKFEIVKNVFASNRIRTLDTCVIRFGE